MSLAEQRIEPVGSTDVLWRCHAGPVTIGVPPPTVELDGEPVTLAARLAHTNTTALPNGAVEDVFEGQVDGQDGLLLRLRCRTAPDNPVVRFRYELVSSTPRRLTKAAGTDRFRLVSVDLPHGEAVEVRLSDYHGLAHSYVVTEAAVTAADLRAGRLVMGPLLTWPLADGHALLAYEHGSQYPDSYLGFRLTAAGAAGRAHLEAVRGSYLAGQDLRGGFATVWLDLAWAPGDRTVLQGAFRDFLLRYQARSPASRQPVICYNTWAHQERVRHWQHRPYLADMTAARMLAEIDAAHEIGVDVFVIDTGWYDRTGDWQVDRTRFPDGWTRSDAGSMRTGWRSACGSGRRRPPSPAAC